MNAKENIDVIILGSGAAGLSAALYSGRYKMNTLLIEGNEFGGATSTAGVIHNWPGIVEKDGYEIMKDIKGQALKEGVTFVSEVGKKVEKVGECFQITTDKNTYRGDSVIFATGTNRRHLGLSNEKELTGKGVHYCVTCDGPIYTGKKIAVVGGGDASVKGVNLAAEYADKIYLIVMDDKLNASPANTEEMIKLGDKVEVLYKTQVREIIGKNKLEKLILDKEFNGINEILVDGLFIEIGAVPNIDIAKELGVELDEHGYIQVTNMMKTNIDGVYACGDTVNHFGTFKQDVTASAMGAVAATSSYEYNKIHGDPCLVHAKVNK
jgi:thioredoxin reductase (NADPH)